MAGKYFPSENHIKGKINSKTVDGSKELGLQEFANALAE
tara:strand:- start:407 stop:523 length:117 start_codon:yes stop_codon:yes gene_type:complete